MEYEDHQTPHFEIVGCPTFRRNCEVDPRTS